MHISDVSSGAYASVSLLRWPGHDQPVICKRNKVSLGAVDMTLREAAILAELDGRGGAPRLVSVLPGLRVIIMEYCGPCTLRSLLRRRRGLQDVFYIRVLEDVCMKLREIHQAGIVHCDLTIANVMVTVDAEGNPCARLIDFGLSAMAGHPWPLGGCVMWSLTLKEKPWYAAETLRGKNVHPASDVVGFSVLVSKVNGILRRPLALEDLVRRGSSRDMGERPDLSCFQRRLRLEKAKLTSRRRNGTRENRINPFWSV